MALGANFDLNMNNTPITPSLPKSLISMIDEAVAQDFDEVLPISDEDRENDMYKAMKFALQCANVEVLYERAVITRNKAPVIPYKQYLFGFRPTDGLCIFAQKKNHKEMLCDGPIRELAKHCFLTQSLQYVLVESEQFVVWSYIPVCCGNDTCPVKARPFDLRRDLFQ